MKFQIKGWKFAPLFLSVGALILVGFFIWDLYGPNTTTITSEQAKSEGGSWLSDNGKNVAELKFVTATGEHVRVTGQIAKDMITHDVMLVGGGGYVYLTYITLTQHSRDGAVVGRYHRVIAWKPLSQKEQAKTNW
jgi:hypothetical protein